MNVALSDRDVTIACADIASAIDETSQSRIDAQIPHTIYTGRLARLLNYLWSDTQSKVVTRHLLERFAARSGFSIGGLGDIREHLRTRGAGRIVDDGRFEITIDSVETVYDICGKYWRSNLSTKEGTADHLIVLLLNDLYLPAGEDHLKRAFGAHPDFQACLQVLLRLGLAIESPELHSYFATKYFGSRAEPVTAFLDRTRAAPRDFVTFLETVQAAPGFPLSDVPDGLRSEVLAATSAGILESVDVVVDGGRVTFLFLANQTDDRIYLSKETTAHFRYNEKYADPTHGRLRMPTVFLDRLIEKGTAGGAENIGKNYTALEEKGVVVTRPGGLKGYPVMVARKIDVLKETLRILERANPLTQGKSSQSLAEWVKNPVEGRLVGGRPLKIDKRISEDLIRAIRDEAR